MRFVRFLQKFDTSVTITILFAISGVLAWTCIGPGAALRGFGAEAVILAATFYVARQYLPWKDAPKDRIKRARTELFIGLVSYVFWIIGTVELFRGGSALPWIVAGTLLPVVILFYGRYTNKAWGLRLPQGRDLLVLAAIVAITFLLSRLFANILPVNEAANLPTVFGATSFLFPIFAGFTSTKAVFIPVLLIIIMEEIFFRVYLQPRLAAYLAGRWALFVQALLYSAMFLPLYLLGANYPLQYAIALTLVLSNGIMAGYFWRKTGNFPLLILLHLLAFSRFGL